MKLLAKIFLLLSVAALGLSFTEAGSEFLYGGLKPIGAVSFIASFITRLLGTEFELYDKQEAAKHKPLKEKQPTSRPGRADGMPQHA